MVAEDLRTEPDDSYIYHTFTVTITYTCDSDYFSLSGVSEQSFQLGSGDTNIGLGMSQGNGNCYKTVQHLYWNNSTSAWEDFTGANFYRGEADNQITIGVSSGSYSSYRPEVYYDMKIIWTSEYSTATNRIMEEQFTIRFYDPCFSNALSISSNMADATY